MLSRQAFGLTLCPSTAPRFLSNWRNARIKEERASRFRIEVSPADASCCVRAAFAAWDALEDFETGRIYRLPLLPLQPGGLKYTSVSRVSRRTGIEHACELFGICDRARKALPLSELQQGIEFYSPAVVSARVSAPRA